MTEITAYCDECEKEVKVTKAFIDSRIHDHVEFTLTYECGHDECFDLEKET